MISILTFLLWLLVYALIAYVVIWIILAIIGLFLPVPPKVAQILYAIAGLIILIYAIQGLVTLGPLPFYPRR